jgi:hypothetical protein
VVKNAEVVRNAVNNALFNAVCRSRAVLVPKAIPNPGQIGIGDWESALTKIC